MKVVCKINNLNRIDDPVLLTQLKRYHLSSDGEVDLLEGNEYLVYGVLFRDNTPWYYLCSGEDDSYPKPFSSDLFIVSDDRISQYWKLSVVKHENSKVTTSLVFSEWAKDQMFYENLLDGGINEIELFEKYRQLMEREHLTFA